MAAMTSDCSSRSAGEAGTFDVSSTSSVSSGSASSSSPPMPRFESNVVHVERTLPRRKWSRIAFCRIRWKSSGSSPGGRVEYFSASFIIASCTMSSAASSSWTENTLCLKARRSTEARKSDSSLRVARGSPRARRNRPPFGRNGSKRLSRAMARFARRSNPLRLDQWAPNRYAGRFPPKDHDIQGLSMELRLPPVAETAPQLSGAEIAIRCLEEEGVEFIFGYPGGAVLFIYDALFKQKKIKHILVRHEQGALHAADGYARATGKCGVALVTSGPGVTNAVTGIATAYMDSIPLVVITGQVPTRAIGLDAFQEVDTVGITRPCVKHNFLVKNVGDLASTIKKAFHIA